MLFLGSLSSHLQRSQTILVLLIASTKHRQTYKQQIKATKNSTPPERKYRNKRELIATVMRTQETENRATVKRK
jgi:hypothetical protein